MSDTSSSLRELDRVEDRIRQQRQWTDSPVLLVEGPDDLNVLRQHLPGVSIFPADGKANALRAVRSLQAWNIEDVLAVVDRDFDDPSQTQDIEGRLHPYARRDLEGMLIGLGVLAHVLEHQGSAAKLTACGGSEALVARLEEIAAPLTSLRDHNARHNYGLSFDGTDFVGKVDLRTLDFRMQAYCAALISRSETEVQIDTLVQAAATAVADDLGPRGKDVIALAGVALRRVAGSLAHAAVDEPVLTGQLHSSAGFLLSKDEWLSELKDRLIG
ncbi:hypothetical protein [Herbiconiux sp. UC225_62]|uniref:hypothetical protein n=1 Tax=Herbiconiux sp. UC225_62 TaxID=3350168 RepID=UPI0036D35F54